MDNYSDMVLKRRALQNHLINEEKRKNDFRIVKGTLGKERPKIKATSSLKSVTREFESVAKASLNNSDDVGSQAVVKSYEGGKTVIVGAIRLNAINKNLVKGGVRVTNGTISFAGKTYKVASNIYLGYKAGNIKGVLNMYKNMTFNKIVKSIKYSKPVYTVRNFAGGTKAIYLNARYRLSQGYNFVNGVASGTIKITPKKIGGYAWKGTTHISKGVYRGTITTVKGIDRFSKTRVFRSGVNGVTNSLKSMGSNSDDIGLQSIGATATLTKTYVQTLRNSYKGIRSTARVTSNVSKTVGKGAYKTARGTIKFAKDVKKQGVKKTSKVWYNAHIKGAGKKLREKVSEEILKALKSLMSKPLLIVGALLLCVYLISSAGVITASSTVGGVIETFKELAEGLKEAVETVVDAIEEFLDSCVEWLKDFFNVSDGDDGKEVEINVDVDIGDNMSICDFLLGTVQVYKAEFGIKVEERRNELLEEGYHDIIFYNQNGTETLQISDIYDENKGLMADKEYVKYELPVWKAIIFGTIGSDFTGADANLIAKRCFKALTKKEEIPYVDINDDGVADYYYCDGEATVDEGTHQCVIKVGDTWVSGLEMVDTRRCYNASGVQYHTSHNTDGISCCVTKYWCGRHKRYTCKGHQDYCWDGNRDSAGSCTNASTTIVKCEDISSCSNVVETLAYCFDGWTQDCGDCDNYSTGGSISSMWYKCNGHELTYCENISDCSNKTLGTEKCFDGIRTDSGSCDNYTVNVYGTATLYTCNGHNVDVCGGHKVYGCGGHTKYVCFGHYRKCWDGYKDNYGSCDNYWEEEYFCYDGIRYAPTSTCNNEKSQFNCKGYTLCLGHRLMKFYLGSKGFDSLLETEFLDRIRELESFDYLTDEEQKELSQLQMYYEFAVECEKNSDPIFDEWYANQP